MQCRKQSGFQHWTGSRDATPEVKGRAFWKVNITNTTTMFRRDASGPMDVDSVHPLGRAAEYALDDDGPAKKRELFKLSPRGTT